MLESKKFEIRRKANNLSGIYGFRDVKYMEGRAQGVRAIELRSDKGLELTLAADRALDIPFMSYKGTNLSLVCSPGLVGPTYFYGDDNEDQTNFRRISNYGSLSTMGIIHSGMPELRGTRQHGLHGVFSALPAENINKFEEVVDDQVNLVVTGDIDQVSQGQEYLTLHRKITLETENNIVRIDDVLENKGYDAQPVMLLYHTNYGYPLLDAGTRVYFSATDLEVFFGPTEEQAKRYYIEEEPDPDRYDEVYFHYNTPERWGFAMIHNEKLGLAVCMHYDTENLPILGNWKCCHPGDYNAAFEAEVAGSNGLEFAKSRGWDRYIQPGEKMDFHIYLEILDDPAKIDAYRLQCKESKF